VVLLEEREELFLVSPFHLVVILDHERLFVGRARGFRRHLILGEQLHSWQQNHYQN
jgi:hypothetical protein